MRMYPAYTTQMVLEEYAIRFFALLEEGYRQDNIRLRTLAHISMLPHLKQEARGSFLRQLDSAAQDLGDILRPSTSDSTLSVDEQEARLKQVLG